MNKTISRKNVDCLSPDGVVNSYEVKIDFPFLKTNEGSRSL